MAGNRPTAQREVHVRAWTEHSRATRGLFWIAAAAAGFALGFVAYVWTR
jgi:hypothetical protein